jgi:hypothetical protein
MTVAGGLEMAPHRTRTRLFCDACAAAGTNTMLGRITRTPSGEVVLLVRCGAGVEVAETGRDGEWFVVCPCGRETVFRGDAVAWKRKSRDVSV